MTTRYAVFYVTRFSHWNGKPDALTHMNEKVSRDMTLEEFKDNYTYVGVVHAAGVDEVFEAMNDPQGLGLNPLGFPNLDGAVMQALVASKLRRTSMCGGDVAVDLATRKVYRCLSTGWREEGVLTAEVEAVRSKFGVES